MDHEEYKRQAKHCFEQSQRAVSAEMKTNWLQIAQGWLSMVPAADGATAEQKFDAVVKDKSQASQRLPEHSFGLFQHREAGCLIMRYTRFRIPSSSTRVARQSSSL
jgi:hypothetical protein